ncbi:hypothetical protein WIW50_00035, partial [Flavobacteriaceae bacterium 3-367]
MDNFTLNSIPYKISYGLRLITFLLLLFSLSSFDDKMTIVSVETYAYTDTDGDGIPDNKDMDDDGDGILDVEEGNEDPDQDNLPNRLDIDSDNDGILDNVEAQTAQDYIAPSGDDVDGNGLDDAYENVPGSCNGLAPIDTDNDGYPNYLDIDSDDDGIPDNVEAQPTDTYIAPEGADDDDDGLDNAYEGAGNEGLEPENTDGTDNQDYLDADSDNDDVPDNIEGNDFNFDGEPDHTFTGNDTDEDGLDDGYEGSDTNDGFDVNDEINNPANDLPDEDGLRDVDYRDLENIDQECHVVNADRCNPGVYAPANFWWSASGFFSSTNNHKLKFTTFNDGTALISGATKSGNCTAEVYVVLKNKMDWDAWSAAGGSFKEEGCSGAVAEDLHYYVIDKTKSFITISGEDCEAEGTFVVSQRPDPDDSTTPNLGVHVGPGGALRDTNTGADGLAGWGWMGPKSNERKWKIDFNFLLDCKTPPEDPDTDDDGVPDGTDIDDDNDGILDTVEDPNLDGDDDPLT